MMTAGGWALAVSMFALGVALGVLAMLAVAWLTVRRRL